MEGLPGFRKFMGTHDECHERFSINLTFPHALSAEATIANVYHDLICSFIPLITFYSTRYALGGPRP